MTPLNKKEHPSISKTIALPIKQCPVTCTLHSQLVYRHSDRCTQMSLYTLVAPDISFHSTKFQPYIPSQSKVIFTHVNSTYTPSWPKTHPWNPSISKTMALPIKQCPVTCTLHTQLVYRWFWQMHTHVFTHTGSPRHSHSFYKVSTLYPPNPK